MWSVPILVGKIIKQGGATHAGKVSAALNAEYIFIILGVIAVATAVMLLRSSRKHPELGLDK
jgi:hypothetical protein